jgi:2-amino-4-hydroxy-6-hydroxymethyldihydropteridine diphosphokinase
MSRALITLGANLGDPLAQLNEALARLRENVSVARVSSIYRTDPAGGPPDQPSFLNAAVSVEVTQTPSQLLATLHQIESDVGRDRQIHWGPRVIDLDLVLYDAEEWPNESAGDIFGGARGDDLVLPHPRLAWRQFALAPAAEIEPNWTHPLLGFTIHQLLERLDATDEFGIFAEDARGEQVLQEIRETWKKEDASLTLNPRKLSRLRMAVVLEDAMLEDAMLEDAVLENKPIQTGELWRQGIPAIAIPCSSTTLAANELMGAILAGRPPKSSEPWT